MTRIDVSHESGDRFAVEVRGHRMTVDQPREIGGDDAGPTPTELFVAGLASCVAFYAQRFMRRHFPDASLRIECEFRMSDDAARVATVDLRIVTPAPLTDELRAAVMRAAEHCTVHNSLRVPPTVRIAVADAALAAAPA